MIDSVVLEWGRVVSTHPFGPLIETFLPPPPKSTETVLAAFERHDTDSITAMIILQCGGDLKELPLLMISVCRVTPCTIYGDIHLHPVFRTCVLADPSIIPVKTSQMIAPTPLVPLHRQDRPLLYHETAVPEGFVPLRLTSTMRLTLPVTIAPTWSECVPLDARRREL